jgi:hypothetical protein
MQHTASRLLQVSRAPIKQMTCACKGDFGAGEMMRRFERGEKVDGGGGSCVARSVQ